MRLSSPHTHLNQASCLHVSHDKRAPPEQLNCLSAAYAGVVKRLSHNSGTQSCAYRSAKLFYHVGVSVFVYGLLNIVSFIPADSSNTVVTLKLALSLSVCVC